MQQQDLISGYPTLKVKSRSSLLQTTVLTGTHMDYIISQPKLKSRLRLRHLRSSITQHDIVEAFFFLLFNNVGNY